MPSIPIERVNSAIKDIMDSAKEASPYNAPGDDALAIDRLPEKISATLNSSYGVHEDGLIATSTLRGRLDWIHDRFVNADQKTWLKEQNPVANVARVFGAQGKKDGAISKAEASAGIAEAQQLGAHSLAELVMKVASGEEVIGPAKAKGKTASPHDIPKVYHWADDYDGGSAKLELIPKGDSDEFSVKVDFTSSIGPGMGIEKTLECKREGNALVASWAFYDRVDVKISLDPDYPGAHIKFHDAAVPFDGEVFVPAI